MTAPVLAYVGLGSNLGDRLATLRVAVGRLDAGAGLRVTACSPVYETAPVGPVRDQPAFLNAVCAVAAAVTPRALLEHLLEVERGLGRVRDVPQGPRVVDLDLLLFGAARVDEPGLCVPHPQLAKRAFVLVPLLDLDPGLCHPLTGEPLRAACARLLAQPIARFGPASALRPATDAAD